MTDKLNITIRIANQAPMSLSINRSDEEVARTAEYNVNQLWNHWSHKFRSKTSTEVLAMVAYRFAELFYTLSRVSAESDSLLHDFEADLDKILLDMGEEPRELKPQG